MLAGKLTDTKIRQAKAQAARYSLADGGGLVLYINPNGSKWWRFRYRIAGTAKMLSLGVYPAVTLKAAREQRDKARELVATGIDPSQQRRDDKAAQDAATVNTFAAMAERWFALKAQRWAPATAAKARTYLDRDLIPKLGTKPIADLRRADLLELLAGIEQRGALDVAKKCREWLSGIFRFALVAEVIDVNPATDLALMAAAAPATRHYPHVSESELPGLLLAIDNYHGTPTTTRAIKVLLLVACRPGELRAAPWAEFNLDAALWTVPAARMKMRRPQVWPLPVQAVALLRAQHELTGHRALVFPAHNKPLLPMSENTIGRALNRMGYKGRQTAHGFRHVISTALNERGFNRDWIERQLAHCDSDPIRGIYNGAEYLDQRRNMMQAWADYLDSARRGGNVVAIRCPAAGS
ncbi:MAG TPA: integrase arm-type DNA-binding domain-containing protein [Nevskiaceae bacterium]|nr:integrase arm-type DNA-binding domain-containing protein [Nevskiaceae bacterium]